MAGIVPRDANGKADPLAWVRTAWPILVALVLGAMWLQGRMETPELKHQRIETHVQSHARLPGHPVLVERVGHLDRRLERIEAKLEEILHEIKNGHTP